MQNCEQTYQVSVKTEDLIAGTSRTIPNVCQFSSAGPVVVDNFLFVTPDTIINPGEIFTIKLSLSNEGLTADIINVTANISCLDTTMQLKKQDTACLRLQLPGLMLRRGGG